jgi:glucose/arabinose dehydrogenase
LNCKARMVLMNLLVRYFLQLVVIAGSVSVAYALYEDILLIPYWILWVSGITVMPQDLVPVGAILVGSSASIYVVAGYWLRFDRFDSVTGRLQDLFVWLHTASISLLAVFVGTEVPFSPHFWVWVGLAGMAIHLLIFLCTAKSESVPARLVDLARFLGQVFRQFLRPAGWAVLIVAAIPVALAFAYKNDPAIANTINSIRRDIAGTSIENQWGLVDIFGQQRFLQPMVVRFSASPTPTLFVLERRGRVVRFDWPSGANEEVVLDFADRVGPVDLENGALGFALHPAFGQAQHPSSSHGYVYYTSGKDGKARNVLSQFNLDSRDSAELVLIDQLRRVPNGFHNGGEVRFGPDGFLYIGMGEVMDGEGHQTLSNALFGGILRIDVNNVGGTVSKPIGRQPNMGQTGNYSIPIDNPFVGEGEVLEEFWAMGLRNPFRFDFDESGNAWIGDVGAAAFEEVNKASGGENFQYPYMEGNVARAEPPKNVVGVERSPHHVYRHSALDRAVIGGVIYSGDDSALTGKYIFGDNYSGRVWALGLQPGSTVTRLTNTGQLGQLGISGFAMALNGDVLVLTLGRKDSATGRILKLVRGANTGNQAVTTVADPERTTDLASMQPRFAAECARCHAPDGKGEKGLGVKMPDFSSSGWQQSRTDEQILTVIRDGGPAAGFSPLMPPWKAFFSEQEMALFVQLIRSLSKD